MCRLMDPKPVAKKRRSGLKSQRCRAPNSLPFTQVQKSPRLSWPHFSNHLPPNYRRLSLVSSPFLSRSPRSQIIRVFCGVGAAENDFDRQFRSFAARKNVTLAPINRFKNHQATKPNTSEVIVLDSNGDIQMIQRAPNSDLVQATEPSQSPPDPKGTRH